MIRRRADVVRRDALRELMEQHQFTAPALAEKLKVHEVTVRRWRSGNERIPERTWRFIKLVLDAASE